MYSQARRMQVTLIDQQGLVLTETTSQVGTSTGHVLVDWAARTDALFRYYFDRRGRAVTLMNKAARYSAIFATRWQMGARCWFLHTFVLVGAAPPRLGTHARMIEARVKGQR